MPPSSTGNPVNKAEGSAVPRTPLGNVFRDWVTKKLYGQSLFAETARRKLSRSPQVPASHRAPRLPARCPPFHLLRLGKHIDTDRLARVDFPKTQQIALADSVVSTRKKIWTPQAKHQQHLRRPGADGPYLTQPHHDLRVG